MTIGHRASRGVAWVVVGGMQLALDGGDAARIAWQILPYALLTLGEVLVSATGLEFAYSQAPPAMKGAMMSFWNLSVTIGNLWVLLVERRVKNNARDEPINAHRARGDRLPDVLLRRFSRSPRPRRSACMRLVQTGRSLPYGLIDGAPPCDAASCATRSGCFLTKSSKLLKLLDYWIEQTG